MYCPSCGQEQISEDTRFCSRCGLLLTGISQVMRNEGLLPQIFPPAGVAAKGKWFRKRGFKKGLFIFLLAFLIVPIIAVLTIAANAEPFAVFISLFLLTVGGLLRMVYSLLFEDDPITQTEPEQENLRFFGQSRKTSALPPQQSIPVSAYAPPKQGTWRDTNDLAGQPSVTEHTTKLLEKED